MCETNSSTYHLIILFQKFCLCMSLYDWDDIRLILLSLISFYFKFYLIFIALSLCHITFINSTTSPEVWPLDNTEY